MPWVHVVSNINVRGQGTISAVAEQPTLCSSKAEGARVEDAQVGTRLLGLDVRSMSFFARNTNDLFYIKHGWD